MIQDLTIGIRSRLCCGVSFILFFSYMSHVISFAAFRASFISLHACIIRDHVAVCIPRTFGVGLAIVRQSALLTSPLGVSSISSIAWFM